MTSVLLISDTEKVQRLFASLEAQGVFQLRVAATLIQGDQEISTSVPDATFVQSRISGFSGMIVLRHLKKTLPKQAKVVLLAGDAEDAEQARQDVVPFLDLTLDDQALADAITKVLEEGGRPPRKKSAAAKQVDLGKIRPPQMKKAGPAPSAAAPAAVSLAAGSPKKGKKGAPEAPSAPVLPEAREAVKGAAKKPAKPVQEPVQEPVKEPVKEPTAPEASARPPVPEKKEPALPAATAEFPVPELREQAAPKTAAETGAPQPEEPPSVEPPVPPTASQSSRSFEEIMQHAAAKGGAAPSAPSEIKDRVHLSKPAPGPTAAPKSEPSPDWNVAGGPSEEFQRGETLAEAVSRAQKKKKRSWVIPLAVALVFIPLAVFYLLGRKTTAPVSPVTPPGPVPAPSLLAPSSAAKKTEAKPAGKPSPETPAQPGPAAKPAPKAGLKTLPPVLQGLRLDPEYGKSQPGWVRYLGATAEYKLFREADLYRAIQVIALEGGTIPDQLLKRVLLEFGGSDSYRVESAGKKGDYRLEHGSVNSDVGFTIYRRKSDLQIKGFVVFYR